MIRILEECQSEDKPTKFQTGDIITHIKYGYRGVIVHTDPRFKGDQIWYLSNQTQPQKEQPWFFVLVSGSHKVTYVAEENLNHYHPGNTVVHPMLTLFFSGYVAELNRYIRNDVQWNPGSPPDAPPPLPPPNFQPPRSPSL